MFRASLTSSFPSWNGLKWRIDGSRFCSSSSSIPFHPTRPEIEKSVGRLNVVLSGMQKHPLVNKFQLHPADMPEFSFHPLATGISLQVEERWPFRDSDKKVVSHLDFQITRKPHLPLSPSHQPSADIDLSIQHYRNHLIEENFFDPFSVQDQFLHCRVNEYLHVRDNGLRSGSQSGFRTQMILTLVSRHVGWGKPGDECPHFIHWMFFEPDQFRSNRMGDLQTWMSDSLRDLEPPLLEELFTLSDPRYRL